MLKVKYMKQDQETKEERKQRKYRYLYQVCKEKGKKEKVKGIKRKKGKVFFLKLGKETEGGRIELKWKKKEAKRKREE